jgi:hypothetical protein
MLSDGALPVPRCHIYMCAEVRIKLASLMEVIYALM